MRLEHQNLVVIGRIVNNGKPILTLQSEMVVVDSGRNLIEVWSRRTDLVLLVVFKSLSLPSVQVEYDAHNNLKHVVFYTRVTPGRPAAKDQKWTVRWR